MSDHGHFDEAVQHRKGRGALLLERRADLGLPETVLLTTKNRINTEVVSRSELDMRLG